MSYSYHHIDKWISANIDLIEECLEREKKTVVFIAGASSSGKSYCARMLKDSLEENGYQSVTLSLDDYNYGLSRIIPEKVNLHYFHSSLTDIPEIAAKIKPILLKIPFDQKYAQSSLVPIKEAIKGFFPSTEDLNLFLKGLHEEWKVLNFDEPTVYDLEEASRDIASLLDNQDVEKKEYSKIVSERIDSNITLKGKDYDVILVEGIYALNPLLLRPFRRENIITDFIDGNPKSLFLRRIIRDAQSTSAGSCFTTSNYFKFIIPSYLNTILPTKKNADIIFINDMTFLEMKRGRLYTTKMEVHTDCKEAIDHILRHSAVHSISYEKDIYFTLPNEANPNENILRLRCYSNDEGKTYEPSSLVHKGIPKVRKDDKLIRPINILIKEGEFHQVWKDEEACLSDFAKAGFLIGPILHKIKWKISYKSQSLTIRYVESQGYYIEFDKPYLDEAITYTKSTIHRYEEKE